MQYTDAGLIEKLTSEIGNGLDISLKDPAPKQ